MKQIKKENKTRKMDKREERYCSYSGTDVRFSRTRLTFSSQINAVYGYNNYIAVDI